MRVKIYSVVTKKGVQRTVTAALPHFCMTPSVILHSYLLNQCVGIFFFRAQLLHPPNLFLGRLRGCLCRACPFDGPVIRLGGIEPPHLGHSFALPLKGPKVLFFLPGRWRGVSPGGGRAEKLPFTLNRSLAVMEIISRFGRALRLSFSAFRPPPGRAKARGFFWADLCMNALCARNTGSLVGENSLRVVRPFTRKPLFWYNRRARALPLPPTLVGNDPCVVPLFGPLYLRSCHRRRLGETGEV